jgi:enamine deaminase RidA (YjgF/YER057c/UK114 family)
MIERHETNSRLSRVVVHNGMAFIAGTVPDTAAASVEDQTREILQKMDHYLALAKSDKGRLLSATIWLKDLKDLAAVNSAWDAWLPEGKAPARSCVQSVPARSEFALVISMVAASS